MNVAVALTDDDVERIASAVVAKLAAQAKPAEHVTVAEASELLRCCERQIRRFVKAGRLRGVKAGGKLLILRASVDVLLSEGCG